MPFYAAFGLLFPLHQVEQLFAGVYAELPVDVAAARLGGVAGDDERVATCSALRLSRTETDAALENLLDDLFAFDGPVMCSALRMYAMNRPDFVDC